MGRMEDSVSGNSKTTVLLPKKNIFVFMNSWAGANRLAMLSGKCVLDDCTIKSIFV